MSDPVQNELAKAISSTVGAPLAELSELIADKIRFMRWKNAVRTLERAQHIASSRDTVVSSPPMKFFLPFMEGCSLEESETDLIDEWARLLVSAADNFSSDHLIFTRILKEIGPSEARLLEKISSNDSRIDTGGLPFIFESIGNFRLTPTSGIISRIKELINHPIPKCDFIEMCDKLFEHIGNPYSCEGSGIFSFYIYEDLNNGKILRDYDDGYFNAFGEDQTLKSLDILKYHRLLDSSYGTIDLSQFFVNGRIFAGIHGCSVTGLGADFCTACIDPQA